MPLAEGQRAARVARGRGRRRRAPGRPRRRGRRRRARGTAWRPAGSSTPPTVAGRVVTRRQTADGWDRSAASPRTAPGITAASATTRAQRVGSSSSRRTSVADEVVRRLVAGEAQREQDRRDLLVRERLGVLVVDVHQRAREVVGAALDALGHQPPQVAAVGDDVLGVLDLLLGPWAPEGQPGAVAAPALEARVVVGRHADQREDDRRRQCGGERRDEVERRAGIDLVEQLGDGGADRLGHAGDAPRRERARRVAAHARVVGRVEADHRGRRAVAAADQDLARLLAQRGQRQCAAPAENVSWSRKIASMSS